MPDTFVKELREFLDWIPKITRKMEYWDKFWVTFEELEDYEKNNQFLHWLKVYMKNVSKPYEEAAFLREMDETAFGEISEYCFQNLIIRNTRKDRVEKESKWDTARLSILRKIMFFFINIAVVNNECREDAVMHMEEIFGIEASFFSIWWGFVEEHEDRLWKVMLMKRYKQMENKLDYIIDLIEK